MPKGARPSPPSRAGTTLFMIQAASFTLADLARIVAERADAAPDQSYTAKLLAKGSAATAKKLGEEELANIFDGAHATADGERHEAGLGRAPDDVEENAAVLVRGGDVEKAELVGAGCVIGLRRLDGIAGVAQIDELHALDDAPVLHVEAGDEADFEGHREIGQ